MQNYMSRSFLFRIWITLFMLWGSTTLAEAKKAEGYVVYPNGDSICGLVKVSQVNLMNQGIVLNGVELEPFHYMVTFKEQNGSRFKTYKVDEIREFGFNFQGVAYQFRQFTLHSNTFVGKDQTRNRFLCLMFEGEVALYKDIIRRNSGVHPQSPAMNRQASVYYEYYLFNKKQGLSKAVKTNDCKELLQLLARYEIDGNFLDQLPDDVSFKDLKSVLLQYEEWKELQKPVLYNL